ncbi:LuxR C-terminal-related transcriptional regulator [Luteococcus sp. OSA5]|uniref:LuxR C-terminal-related transcriptional regulator n=1 Tax=Luteococcus sp. OSA5 TaxID=3401630 RepID=UPI003B4381E9
MAEASASSMDGDLPMAEPPPKRLMSSLDRLLRARIAVVSGPAGHGKRTLVRSWLAAHPEVEARWLTSPDELGAVEEQAHPIGEKLLALVVAERSLLQDSGLVARLLELAERLPRLRLVFVGRTRPDAPLGSLAARGLLVDISGETLTLTRQEMAALLHEHNPQLPPERLDRIMARTRGWPAVARILAAEPLTWAHTSKVSKLTGSYLEAEVLSGLSPDDIDFLQQVCPLPTVDPPAAAWMTGRGDAAAQLTRLQALGVPIHWDDANTISLNPMLRDHLRRRLAEEQPDRSTQLTERAALWLRNRERRIEAIELAMGAGLPELAWMIAGEFLTVHTNRPELAEALPTLNAVLPPGWGLDISQSVPRGLSAPRPLVAQMEAMRTQMARLDNNTARFGHVALTLGMARRLGYPATIDVSTALQISREAASREVHEYDLALLSAVHTEHGLWLLHQGRIDEAAQSLLHGLGLARVVKVPWVVVTTLSTLAWIHADRGEVAEARQLAEEALEAASGTTFVTDSLDEFAVLAMALTAIDTGDLPAARDWLEMLAARTDRLAENDALRTHVRAMYEVADDSPGAARRLVEVYLVQPGHSPTPWHELLVLLAGFDAALAQNDVGGAAAMLGRIRAIDHPCATRRAPVLQARLWLAEDRAGDAYDLLAPLVAPDGSSSEPAKLTLYRLMIFGMAADDAHHADEALCCFQRAGVLADRLGLNTSNARHTRVAAASRRDIPLTEAERQVLQRLESGKTLGETAEELFISLNTLKTHLRRIYKKLGVSSREEAIARATLMGLRG